MLRGPDERAFLPAALELIETPPSPLARITALSLCALVVLALAWSWFGHVDVVAIAEGRVVPSGRVKTVQAPELARVAAIRVKDGDPVEAGQVLITLEAAEAQADVARLALEQQEARLEAARAVAALKATDTEIPLLPVEAEPAALARHQALLASMLAEQRGALAALAAEARRAEAERQTLQAELAKVEAMLPLLVQRDEARSELARRGHAPALVVLEDHQARLSAEHERQVLLSRLTETTARIAGVQEQAQQQKAAFAARQGEAQIAATQRLEALGQEAIKAGERLARRTITSPIAGTVQQLAVHTVGGVVDEAQGLLVVVPQEASLEVEAWVENRDIGFVEAGQEAAVKVAAFPFTRYGLLEGTVLDLSRDAVAPPASAPGNPPKAPGQTPDAGAVYAARVALARTSLNVDGKEVTLTPGMAVTVEIKTTRRRLIDTLLSPLQTHTHEALRER